jgi:glyoxylase-like metal-dependent hydrolase (beta-lactamase superfamily II)
MADQPPQSLEVLHFTLGPVATNTYIVAAPGSREAVVIDPAWEGHLLRKAAQGRGWEITAIWLTHAHFDHFGGVVGLVDAKGEPPPVALHPDDLPLWQARGGARLFGLSFFDPGPRPSMELQDGMELQVGEQIVEVRHTPGHSPGHVIFVHHAGGQVFCGDLIFQDGVGRTDLPGGDWDTLLRSIRQRVLDLPDHYVLFPGHGPQTTVGRERRSNPFILAAV